MVMSPPERRFFVLFMGFWLLTDALYPYLAQVEAGPQAHRALLIALAGLAIVASAAALGIGLLAPQILTIIYGSTLGAAGLFRILLIALPIDFCFSLIWTVLVSRGYERPVLYSLGAAAGANVFLNLVFIPRFQANAAAWATVASYALLLLATQRAFAASRQGLLPRPKWMPTPPSTRISTQQAIHQLRAEVWGRGLGLENFSPFASTLPAASKPEKSSFPLASAVCYANA